MEVETTTDQSRIVFSRLPILGGLLWPAWFKFWTRWKPTVTLFR